MSLPVLEMDVYPSRVERERERETQTRRVARLRQEVALATGGSEDELLTRLPRSASCDGREAPLQFEGLRRSVSTARAPLDRDGGVGAREHAQPHGSRRRRQTRFARGSSLARGSLLLLCLLLRLCRAGRLAGRRRGLAVRRARAILLVELAVELALLGVLLRLRRPAESHHTISFLFFSLRERERARECLFLHCEKRTTHSLRGGRAGGRSWSRGGGTYRAKSDLRVCARPQSPYTSADGRFVPAQKARTVLFKTKNQCLSLSLSQTENENGGSGRVCAPLSACGMGLRSFVVVIHFRAGGRIVCPIRTIYGGVEYPPTASEIAKPKTQFAKGTERPSPRSRSQRAS